MVGRLYGRVDAAGRTWLYAVPERYYASPGYDVSELGWLSNGEVDGRPFTAATHLSITTTGHRIEVEDWAGEAPQFYGARCKKKDGTRYTVRDGHRVQTSTVGLWLIGDDIASGTKAIRAVHDEPVRIPKWTAESLAAYERLLGSPLGIDELLKELRHEADPHRRTALERAIEHRRGVEKSLELQARVRDALADRSDGWAQRYGDARRDVEEQRRRTRSKPYMLTTTTQWPPPDFPPAYEGHPLLISRGDTVRVVALETMRDEKTGGTVYRRIVENTQRVERHRDGADE